MVTRIGPKKPVRHYLREWRETRGLTQQQLADRVGTGKDQISRWENSKRGVSTDVLAALAEGLNITTADVFRDPKQPSVDALLAKADPKLRAGAVELVSVYLKRASGE